ncbi:restriction endonuclease subunit S [Roseovarius arcticus]|uniref:restriction endonuclease subunit S n=1 Tax=Roseovarius arcticus TaxID=2547404 RepID=UPI001110D1F5|nr:restriction endonuclease subunit S [Roseovarius arcticus]
MALDQHRALKEVGADEIPDGWSLSVVGSACRINNTLRHPLSVEERKSMKGDYPYFGPTGCLDKIDEYRIDGRYALIGEDGDHFINFSGKPQTQVVSGRFNVNNHAHVVGEGPNCTVDWFFYSFHHRRLIPHLSRQGAGRYKLNKAALEKIPMLVPPLPEQRKIAEILSTWDRAIETAQALLATARTQKRALMQSLLTGKRRFPEFEGQEWREVRLGSLGSTFNGLTGKTKQDFGEGMPYIPYLNIFQNSRIDPSQFDYVDVDVNDRQNRVYFGDIFFTTSSETPNEVGMSSVLLDDIPDVFLNSFCFGFRLHDFETLRPRFARFLLRGQDFRRLLHRLAQGATRYNLSKRHLLDLQLTLPLVEEQEKIADVLEVAQSEEANLSIQIMHLRTEKKALMQQLLTGKRRVVLDA